MKQIKNIFMRGAAALALLSMPGLLFAQRAGDIISGVVSDSEGPLMMVNVTERDASNRIVASAVTDIEGQFSFRLVSPNNRIEVSYVGCETVNIPITKTYFEIVLNEITEIAEVEVRAERIVTSHLPIPEREMSQAIQTLNMEELEGLGMTSIDEAIQGRFAGLDLVFDSGNLGARSTINLRGVSTMTGDANPLIVVDGNIFEIDANLRNNFDYQNDANNEEKVSELLNINPQDIESISILKDAAATAQWGARGSNGVMEIKTKRGSRGQTRVNYSYRVNADWQPEGYKLLNGDQYTMFLKESFFNPQLSDNAANIIELNYDPTFSEYEMYNNNTDWVSHVKKIGLQQAHNIAVSGGGEKANFRISAGFDDQTGSVIGQKMNRFTTRVAFDYFVSDRIKVVTNFSMVYSKNKTNPASINAAMRMMPNLAIYYEDEFGNPTGEYYHMLATASSELPRVTNPLAEADERKSHNLSLNINPEFQMVYNLLGLGSDETRLTYDGRVTFGVQNSGSDNFTPASLDRDGWAGSNANRSSNNSSKSSNITTTHQLTFVPYLKREGHSVMSMVRFQVSNSNSKGMNDDVSGLPSGIQLPNENGVIQNMSTSAGRSRGVNGTFSIHYAYRGKYMFDFTARTDGNTKFGDNKRWGTFPAVSARWNIIDEDFMAPLRDFKVGNTYLLTMFSIRPSWGITGNAPGQDGLFYSKYSAGSAYLGISTINPSNIRLSNMQWEEKQTWNLGFDFGLFSDRLTFSVDLYSATVTKMLNSNYPIPTSSGFSSLSVVNEGSMKNEGWELALNANRLIRKGQFTLGGNIAFADNTNQILEMNPIMLDQKNGEFNFQNLSGYLSYVALKNAFGSIYGFKYLGVYQYSDYSEIEEPGVSGPNAPVVKDAEGNVILNSKGRAKPMMFAYGNTAEYEFVGGDAIYEDINHDGNINELDIVYLGTSLPKLNGGFGVNMTFGRLSWRNQFNFRWGNKIVNQGRRNAEAMYNTDNTSAAINWRWRVEGDDTVMPRALRNYGYNSLPSDRYVESGAFLRWNYTALSYSIDPKYTKGLGLSQVSINMNLNNLINFTKYSGMDPEVGVGGMGVATDGNQTPRSRRFTMGVTIQF
ncbi:MAG TPA: SusC/RagA family TonB-linked outer membrane protein [Bacteroidaceae bacterium]|nr:SusC/RagA family TonB-linked outer membrane protein [Bacteroidaceae bacterium]HQL26652.1 SusC/RagA family TonB-linked outer membrane protein [Bacteroidaceae bacterium]